MAVEFLTSQDSYTFAQNINGTKKLKTIGRLDPEKLGTIGNASSSTQLTTVKTFVDAMSGVIAGTQVDMQEEEVDGAKYRYRVNRTLPIKEVL